jgi:S-adenosylmethionine synthetase
MNIDDRLRLGITPIATTAVEIVERKGTGHPDSICDALAETAGLTLCRLYREQFGVILHYNVDKVLLWGGEAQPAFRGGRIIKPIEIYIAGRATRSFKGVDHPVDSSVAEACRVWLCDHLPALDASRHVKLPILLRPTSEDLVSLFIRQQEMGAILANDTSRGAGYAPEHHPNHIKVMGVRCNRDLHLTVAVAFIRHTSTPPMTTSSRKRAHAMRRALWRARLSIRKHRSNSMPPMCRLAASI